MDQFEPVNVGVLGLGGYGANVIQAFQADQASATPHVRLTAVCSNDFDRHPDAVAGLRAAGVKLIADADAFLAEPTEAVWLPLPIPLHRPMTEKALAAGKAVMCEKPAAGCVDDVDAMIAARDRYRRPAIIGFNDLYDPSTLPLKRQLLAGRIGAIRSATMFGCWPRGKNYYDRADWAGAFRRNGAWVMDSPANNAMSHHVNVALFLLGPTPETSAQPVEVEAELYRVNPIENYDTVSMRLTLQGGATILILMTHACQRPTGPDILIRGQRGQVLWSQNAIQINTAGNPADNPATSGNTSEGTSGGTSGNTSGGGDVTQTIPRVQDTRPMMVRRLAGLARGLDEPDLGMSTLESARAQVLAVNGASEAAAIQTLDESIYKTIVLPRGQVRVIPDIEQTFEACAQGQKMLHESGLAAWSVPAGRKNLRGYTRFAGPRDLAPAGSR